MIKLGDRNALISGAIFTIAFHCALFTLLYAAASTDHLPVTAVEERAEAPRRRPAAREQALGDRRVVAGVLPRKRRLSENSFGRRPHLDVQGRRRAGDELPRPFRFIEIARGRKDRALGIAMRPRGIDFGAAPDSDVLHAMLVPKLGLKKADKRKLPKLTKYEQPDKKESGINISRENPDGEPLRFKEFKKKKSQYDKRRKKKPSLSDLIDAPDDDDPRMRATRLDDIVGSAEGEVWGEGTEGQAGNIYLGKVERSLRRAFNVPVFLSRDELKKLVVEVLIQQMDADGKIVSYQIRRESSSGAFNSAAIEAVKRFVPEEGGSKTFPQPDSEMLNLINQRGVLIRLEGRKLK